MMKSFVDKLDKEEARNRHIRKKANNPIQVQSTQKQGSNENNFFSSSSTTKI